MSDIVTIGGNTQFAKAVCIVELNGEGFPIDPTTGQASTSDVVVIGGFAKKVEPVAAFTLDGEGNPE